MFLHHFNDIEMEHNLKQNIYTGRSLLYLRDTEYKNSKNENVLINNKNNL